jgi:2-phosphosulfolactate phosphatase
MSAPDLPPPPVHDAGERPLAVHLTPGAVRAEELAGSVVVVIDALRATSTIAAALAAGAERIVPALTVEEARARAADIPGALLGGERGGVRPEGFVLGNSPASYTAEIVAGRTVVFTTTNGTAALLHAGRARRVLVGSLVNLTSVCDAVAQEPGTVHIVCAGTRDAASLDDCVPAGAMVARLRSVRGLVAEDSGLLCLHAWEHAVRAGALGIEAAMRAGRGGRNLARIGLHADIAWCSRVDGCPVLGAFDAERGEIRRV